MKNALFLIEGFPVEPEVHIIEKYFQVILGCLTMTNIKCRGGKEIDLLAINPLTQLKYHVESSVSTTSQLRDIATYKKNGGCRKNGLDYFNKEKFEHPNVKEKVNSIFGKQKYEKLLVVWKFDFPHLSNYAIEKYRLHVTSLSSMIFELMDKKLTAGSRDDVLRLMELVFLFRRDARDFLREWEVQKCKTPEIRKNRKTLKC